jgi:hypothetical protein
MSFLTGTNAELIYASTAAGTAKASFTSEVTINDTAAMGPQAYLPKGFFPPDRHQAVGKSVRIICCGIVSSTATPTFTWTVRGGASGATSGAILAGTAALTTASGIANIPWALDFTFVLESLGAGAASTIRNMNGSLTADGYGAATTTRAYGALGTATQPGTATTFDTTIDNFININATCSASSASNSIQVLQLLIYGLN